MNLARRRKRNADVLKYLSTPIGHKQDGTAIYPTYWQAAVKFDLSQNHIYRIKKAEAQIQKGAE